jgi:hypothetical protein
VRADLALCDSRLCAAVTNTQGLSDFAAKWQIMWCFEVLLKRMIDKAIEPAFPGFA